LNAETKTYLVQGSPAKLSKLKRNQVLGTWQATKEMFLPGFTTFSSLIFPRNMNRFLGGTVQPLSISLREMKLLHQRTSI